MSAVPALACADFLERAAAYVLGLLEGAERAACDRHLALAVYHPLCTHAVAEARRVAVSLSAALPTRAPRPELWTAIELRLREKPVLDEATPPVEILARPRLRLATPTGCE